MIAALLHSSFLFSARTWRGRMHRRRAFSGPAHPTAHGLNTMFYDKGGLGLTSAAPTQRSNVYACANVSSHAFRAVRTKLSHLN